MAEVNITPELRFPEFDGNWVRKKLGKALSITSSSRVLKDEWTEDGVPFFRSSDVVAYFKGEKNKKAYISFELYDSLSKKIGCVKKDDILITGGGSIGIPFLIKNNDPLYFKDADLLWIKINDKIHGYFLYSFFLTQTFRKYLQSISHVGTIAHYTVVQAKNTICHFPTFSEQQKIASFLTAIDERIQLLQKKKAKLVEYKKGVMQKLFSQQIRFKIEGPDGELVEPPDWEEKKLGEICNKQSSNISANSLEESGGDYKIYGATGFLQFVDFYREEEPYISIVKDGAGVGRILLCEAKSSVLGTLDILKPKEENNIKFLYALISNIRFEKYITGSTIPHIYFKDYSKEKINVPIPAEQHKIAAFLTSIDDSIESIRVEIDGSIEYKKGLLQKMFV